MLKAKTEKFWKLEDERKAKEKRRIIEEALRPWTKEETYKIAKITASEIAKAGRYNHVIDGNIEPVFSLLAAYFSNDKSFEEKGYDLNKGILLQGDVGVGKTDLMRAFAKNKRQCFLPISCNEIENKIRQQGVEYWHVYTSFVPGHGSTSEYYFQPNIAWMFDDLGTEEVIKDYGNTLDALEKIIHERYMLKEKIPFSSLHLTTNLSGDMIESRYGYRMRSRIREMFNVIKLTGTDRRK